jgi:hypothetical protein
MQPLAIMIAATLSFLIGGCSIALGMSQYSENHAPDPIKAGTSRKQVESELGKPVEAEDHDDGSKTVLYKKKVYAEDPKLRFDIYQSGDLGRRVLVDIASLFIAEIFLTPIEILLKTKRRIDGRKYDITLIYDAQDNVVQTWLP